MTKKDAVRVLAIVRRSPNAEHTARTICSEFRCNLATAQEMIRTATAKAARHVPEEDR